MSYKDRLVEPFVYQPCKNLPGMIAVPVSEQSQNETNKDLTDKSKDDTIEE